MEQPAAQKKKVGAARGAGRPGSMVTNEAASGALPSSSWHHDGVGAEQLQPQLQLPGLGPAGLLALTVANPQYWAARAELTRVSSGETAPSVAADLTGQVVL